MFQPAINLCVFQKKGSNAFTWNAADRIVQKTGVWSMELSSNSPRKDRMRQNSVEECYS